MKTIHLDEIELSHALQGWESPKANRAVTGVPLAIAGQSFARGIGTHTVGWLGIALYKSAKRFTAKVGVDDKVGQFGLGKARFLVRGDGRILYDSGVVLGGETARDLDLDVSGLASLELISDAPDDNTHHGHADWCDGSITYENQAPTAMARPRGEPKQVTPKPIPNPRFVAGWLLAARPGSPVHWTIPCIGAGSLRYSAEGLPSSLHLNAESGLISGFAPFAGRYPIRFTAQNEHGQAHRVMTLMVGDELAATPPMGWSSWNCCHANINDGIIRANAQALVDAGLHRLGYRFVNIDDGWQGSRSRSSSIPMALQANAGFPDMARLVEDIHSLGVSAGMYHVPNIFSPQGLAGASSECADGTSAKNFQHGVSDDRALHDWMRPDIAQFAAWGFDYVKVDNRPTVDETREINESIRASGRDMILSLSANMPRELIAQYRRHAQLWRTTGDLIDTWFSIRNKLRSQVSWQGLGGPGAWNDPDMLVVGEVGPGWNAPLQASRLSYAEQYLHIGMWAFLAAPLMIGGDLTRLDDFTKNLLANPEIIEIDQDPLGAPARLIDFDEERGLMRWRRDLIGGEITIALANIGDETASLGIDLAELGLTGTWIARDPWRGQDLEKISSGIRCEVPAHSHQLFRIRPHNLFSRIEQ